MDRHKMQALVETFRAATARLDRRLRADVSGDSAKLYLYDAIGSDGWGGGIAPKDVISALDKCGGKPLDIFVNSPGGDVFDGVAIYNALRRYGNTKTVHVDGLAASAASLVIMAGDRIECAHNAQVMIHDPWAFAMGAAVDLRKTADLLEQTGETLVSTYASRTKQTPEDLRAWMAAETWMTAQEALARGFCDAIDAPGEDPDGKDDEQAEGEQARARMMALVEQMKERLTGQISRTK